MATEFTLEVVRDRFRGYDDPRFPIGSWRVQGSAAGDGSGGANSVIIRFAEAGVRDYNLYNIERIMGSLTTTVQNGMLSVNNMGEDPDFGDTLQSLNLFYTSNGASITPGESLDARSLGFLPLWLGAKRVQTIAANLRLETENTTGVTSGVRMDGFIWSPRSVGADGGPQRPPGGRYGN